MRFRLTTSAIMLDDI